MSSLVPRSQRLQKQPRRQLSNFTEPEQKAIKSASQNFGNPVVVFGSRVRGNWADDSDIDIGVIGYKQSHHASIKQHMTNFSGIKVDLFKIENARTHKHIEITCQA